MSDPEQAEPTPPPAEPASPQDFLADLATPSWELVEKSSNPDDIETR